MSSFLAGSRFQLYLPHARFRAERPPPRSDCPGLEGIRLGSPRSRTRQPQAWRLLRRASHASRSRSRSTMAGGSATSVTGARTTVALRPLRAALRLRMAARIANSMRPLRSFNSRTDSVSRKTSSRSGLHRFGSSKSRTLDVRGLVVLPSGRAHLLEWRPPTLTWFSWHSGSFFWFPNW